MDKITKSLLDAFSVQYGVESLKEDVKFEHFSNFSIISKLNRSTFDLDDIHTGKGGDIAIDGLCIIANGHIITEIDELTEVIAVTNYLDTEIIFIQAKTTSSFSGSDIGSFIHGVKDFLSDRPRLVHNDKIQKYKEIWDCIICNSPHMTNRRPYCKLYYICTGKWVNDQNLQAILDSGIEEIEALGIFEEVTIKPNGAADIQRLYHETKNKLSTTINFQNRITFPDISDVKEAYLGIIAFSEFIKLIQDENQKIHNIFDDNVRDFQGENIVNKRIKSTLHEKKFDLFCLLNNGITLVASSITSVGNKFTLRDYQIVNGCQTSNILHHCQGIDGIKNLSVPIKIIVTESEDIKTEITLATNSQTEVKTEHLEALSQFQKRLETYFHAENDGIKLYYERRSQQYNSAPGIKRAQIISIPIQIKSFASMFLDSPHLVSGYYGTIVNRFRGKIFGTDHKHLTYYVSALCYYRIEQLFRNGDLPADYKKARFHIMMIVCLIKLGLKKDPLNSKDIERKCENFKKVLLDEVESLLIFKLALEIFEKSGVDISKRQYKSESDTDLVKKAVEAYCAAHKISE